MACVNSRYRPYRGKAARKRGCDNFRALPGSGLAHHPYTLRRRAQRRRRHRDDVTIANLPRIVRALNRLGRKNRLKRARMKVWITEFGFQTDPPDPFQTPIRKVPGFLGLSEWLSYRNPRVASYSQYLLYDDRDTGGFQTGIRFAGGQGQARASTRRTGCRSSSACAARARSRSGAASARRAAGSRVTMQSKRGGKWRKLGRATHSEARLLPQELPRRRAPASASTASRARGRTSVQLKARAARFAAWRPTRRDSPGAPLFRHRCEHERARAARGARGRRGRAPAAREGRRPTTRSSPPQRPFARCATSTARSSS